MGKFFDKNGKTITQLFVNQIMMSIFGLMVITASFKSDALIIFSSVLAFGLFMYLTYHFSWRAGAKKSAETLKSDNTGSIKTGFLIILCANLFNIATMTSYAIIRSIVNLQEKAEGMSVFIGGIVWTVIRFTNAVYIGIETLLFPNPNVGLPLDEAVIEVEPLLTPGYFFLLTLIPVFAVGILAYYLGASEISIAKKLGLKPDLHDENRVNYKINRK